VLAPTVALLLRKSDTYAYVAAGLDERQPIRLHRSLAELLQTLAKHEVSLVALEAADEQGRSNASAVAAVRAYSQRIPILVVCALTPGETQLVLEAVNAGATGLLFRGIDDSKYAIRTAIQQVQRNAVSHKIYDELITLLPPAAAPLLRYAISRVADEPSVTQAAREIGVDRKTLANWLGRSSRLSPREFLNWVRLAIAIDSLERTARSAERVALELGFPSGTAFRNMLRRYTGHTTSELRSVGSLGRMLEVLKDRLRADPTPMLRAVGRSGSTKELRRPA
jgi:AraC-like DNA-binding protein